jgi:hypothetical protein
MFQSDFSVTATIAVMFPLKPEGDAQLEGNCEPAGKCGEKPGPQKKLSKLPDALDAPVAF